MQQEHGQASMVEEGCDSCRKWQEHYYWEHMDVSKIRFFKLMTGDFAKGTSIPEKFAQNFKGQITGGFELNAPSGKTWHISVDKRGDELFLMSGWEDFVKAHELQENDLLLFTCCGNSSFQVLVFEASGCERVSSMFGNQIGPDMCKHVKNIVGQHGEPDAPNTSNFIVNYSANSDDGSDDDFANSNCYYSMFANRLRDEEKEEIIGLASIQRNNPAFVTVLKKQHVQRNNNSLELQRSLPLSNGS
ncbi:hypothetical protein PVAP13_3KG267100 [Panicum virgatum]|uniref:TF-B3 domain-containing protein n=1 Tax=Panicum virgatum TaxID=38727 RepID=A0A8T0VAS8_PANVG|nr:hypothetical protein PVAP13_3KG267100 [Panicum virgatum]